MRDAMPVLPPVRITPFLALSHQTPCRDVNARAFGTSRSHLAPGSLQALEMTQPAAKLDLQRANCVHATPRGQPGGGAAASRHPLGSGARLMSMTEQNTIAFNARRLANMGDSETLFRVY